jgi:hypothetical protein
MSILGFNVSGLKVSRIQGFRAFEDRAVPVSPINWESLGISPETRAHQS